MNKILLLLLLCSFSALISAQAVTVLGGNHQARDCHRNATLVSSMRHVSKSMLEPCDYALEKVKLIRRDRASTFTNRGILLAARNQLEEALDSYRQAISITPDTGEIYVNRGNVWFQTGDYDRALEDYKHALTLGINQMYALHYNLGLALEKLGRKPEAEQAYRTALEIRPDWLLPLDRLMLLQEGTAREGGT